MDNISSNNIEVALIQHKLINCNAEMITPPSEVAGGSIEVIYNVETPKKTGVFKKNDSFELKLLVEINGKLKTEEIAFRVSCKMEGNFRIVNCDDIGVSTDNTIKLWSLSANLLCPLAVQFAMDMVSRMGYKNVNVPLFIPRLNLLGINRKKNPSKKTKK